MADDTKWTVRGIAADAREAVEEVHELTGIPYGRLLTDAIRLWYSELDEEDPIPPVRRAA